MTYSINEFNNLREAIITKLEAEETAIQEAHFEHRNTFDGYPAAVVNISQNEALYNSDKLDRMTFVFSITIYIPLIEDRDAHDVEIDMGKAYWEVLNMFNSRDSLSGYADIVEPIPSIWGYEESGQNMYRVAEINLRCVKFVSNN